MARDVGHVRVMMSSRVLLNLEDADSIFKSGGIDAYRDYMRCAGEYDDSSNYNSDCGGRMIGAGPMVSFAQKLLHINERTGKNLVEIIVSAKDEADTAGVIFSNLDRLGLGHIEMRLSTSGGALEPRDLDAFEVDLLLTRNADDAQMAVNHGVAAAQLFLPAAADVNSQDLLNLYQAKHKTEPLRLFFDGDAVAFGSSSERYYREHGIDLYRDFERAAQHDPIEEGPFTKILQKLSGLNKEFPRGEQPFLLSLLTARGAAATPRIMRIFEHYNIQFNDRILCMGGASKADVLKSYKPDLFLDDQVTHLEASAHHCPTGLVPYHHESEMAQYEADKQNRLLNLHEGLPLNPP